MLRAAALLFILARVPVKGVGAVDCAPASGSLTIQTSSDVTSLTACKTFTGNVLVAADGPSTIDLTGLTSIIGNLDIENVNALTSLSSSTLTAATSLTLNNLPVLSNLSFPALANFTALRWFNLPNLEDCAVATGALSAEVQVVTILNTGLRSLEWLTWPVGSHLNISSNDELREFSIPYSTIEAGSALTLTKNPALSSFNVSLLSEIYGGLQIYGNNAITQLSFNALAAIGGYLQLSGTFNNVTMPNLDGINGALRVETTGDIDALCDNLLTNKQLNGHYDCTSNSQKLIMNPSVTAFASSTATSTATAVAVTISTTISTSDGDSGTSMMISNKAKAGIAVAVILFTFFVVACTIFCMRRRSRRKVKEIAPINKVKSTSRENLQLESSQPAFVLDKNGSAPGSPLELASPNTPPELDGAGGWSRNELAGVVPIEMDGQHGVSEVETGPERFELPA
ncbi:hypothetical protein K504DRAFT_452589 [Pleomassaria siparia CBS 279.74]|uniref:Receptor L-domain domain-containing protein n=1 Tax=Pleomassaria siparia CBS 279.74 TaxID=1314801 RepID=A0A6G1KHT6_9PLEO|nr:hypothetical protein K504DRAFT_452589 [Pleomassaria siparia CBS 279.74]